jgi:hypothetical protein
MIPLLLTAIGAYLIGDSQRSKKTFAEGGEVKLLAPNGKPSNLTPKQYSMVRTPEFKAWFEGSKIVDENGEPMVVRHQSQSNELITTFTDKKISKGIRGRLGRGDKWAGIYFTSYHAEGLKDMFDMTENKEGLTYDVFLNCKNVLVLENTHYFDFEQNKPVKSSLEVMSNGERYMDARSITSSNKEKLQQLGYDGVWANKNEGYYRGIDELIVFDSKKIKMVESFAKGGLAGISPLDREFEDLSWQDQMYVEEHNGLKDGHYKDYAGRDILVATVNGFTDFEKGGLTEGDYSKWKRKNVTYRGVKELGQINNRSSMLGQGLYTTPSSNKSMAKGYGDVYFVVNGRPKNPKSFQDLNQWEIWFQNSLVYPLSKKAGNDFPDVRDFHKQTNIRDEVMKLGYDGIEIKGREMVNFTPEDVRYFKTEAELKSYFDSLVAKEKVYYHGSDENIKVFDINKSKKWNKFGIFFTSNKEFAETFGGEVKAVHLKISNPKIISQQQWNGIRDRHAKDSDWFATWKSQLIEEGYDALKIKEDTEMFAGVEMVNPEVVAVFRNSQIEIIK